MAPVCWGADDLTADPATTEESREGRRHLDLPGILPQVEGVTGTYFTNSKPRTSSKSSYDQTTAARLRKVSVDLVRHTAGV